MARFSVVLEMFLVHFCPPVTCFFYFSTSLNTFLSCQAQTVQTPTAMEVQQKQQTLQSAVCHSAADTRNTKVGFPRCHCAQREPAALPSNQPHSGKNVQLAATNCRILFLIMYEFLPPKKADILKRKLAVVMHILMMSKSYLLEFMQNFAKCLCYANHKRLWRTCNLNETYQ